MKIVRKDCFWYRPWQDMGATMPQCEIAPMAECPCEKDCKWYISKINADNLVWEQLQLRED